MGPGACFSKVPERCFVLVVQGQSLENCENNTIKLSVYEANLNLPGLWARNCATI